MRQIYDGWRHYGADVRWLDRAEVSQRLGSSAYHAAWETVSAGHLNPYALAQGLARVAAGAGALIAERSTVNAIVSCGRKWRAITDSGSVVAAQVLLATNAATTNIWPNLSRMPLPVSEPPQVPMHRIAVQVARRIHPWNRLRDRLGRTTWRTTDR